MLISQKSYCALIVIVELGIHPNAGGMSLCDVSRRHDIPLKILHPIVERLNAAGILTIEQGGDNDYLLFLNRAISDLFVFDIVQLFDKELFCGEVSNEEVPGKWMNENYAGRLINEEKKLLRNYLQNRLKKISICRWCYMLEKHRLFIQYPYCVKNILTDEKMSDNVSFDSSLIGIWQITEELILEPECGISLEILEFKTDGRCVWSFIDDSGCYEVWSENFSYRVNESAIVFFNPGCEQASLVNYRVNENNLTLYTASDVYKVFSKNGLACS